MTFRTTMLLLTAVTTATVAKAQWEHRMTVDDLFQLVESNSKTLLSEKISVEFAQKGIEAARAARLPELTVSAAVSLNGDVLVTDRDLTHAQGFAAPRWGNSLALEAQQVVYAGGAVDAGIRMAQLQASRAGVSEQQRRQQQRFLALGQYLELYKLQRREQVYEQNILLTQRLIADVKARHQQGMALRNDVTRYELQMETLRLGLRKLQDQRTILNYQLCNQLGLQEQTLIAPDSASVFADLSPLAAHLSNWQNEAQTSAASVLQAELGEKMAREEVRLAKSEQLPKVAVVAADNFAGPFTYDIPPIDKNINYWYVGVGVKYPISSLFKQNKRVQQARIRTRQAEQQHAVAAEQLNNQVQEAWTYYQQSFVELETQQKSVQLARQNYEVVHERYLSQLALITDMTDAQNVRLSAELNESDARIGIAYAYYRLRYIAGTL